MWLFDCSPFLNRYSCSAPGCDPWTGAFGFFYQSTDWAIFAAYFVIPVILWRASLQKDWRVPRFGVRILAWLFGAFILLCGLTHACDGLAFHFPCYRFFFLVRLATAIVSWATVLALEVLLVRRVGSRGGERLGSAS